MKTTNDLMKVISSEVESEKELDSYINNIDSYSDLNYKDYFLTTMKKHGRLKNEVVKKSEISRTYCYQMLNGMRKPGRDNAIALAIASGFSLEETIRYLELLEQGILYSKNKRDSIIIYAITHRLTVANTNELLYSKGESILGEK